MIICKAKNQAYNIVNSLSNVMDNKLKPKKYDNI